MSAVKYFPSSYSEVRDELRKLADKITESVKYQQPTTINNDNNYMNIFLNEKCHNACDISKFITGIDFSKEAITIY